ncbi:MAG: uroporphyrinogen decarboxylase family protein [Anaerolineales bacterium]|jgi:hypothetical protein
MIIDEVKQKSPNNLPWMIDLSLWYAWHSKRGSMPSTWSGLSQIEIANQLGAVAWQVIKPWELTYEGVEVQIEETEDERVLRYVVAGHTLSASWILGPDGDWWQTNHLISTPDDFESAIALAASISYRVEWGETGDARGDSPAILAIELPKSPLSALLHDYLGWGEGLLMLGDHEQEVDRLLAALETNLRGLVKKCADVPGSVLFCPDNLDGQYISPDMFARHLAPSYIETSNAAHAAGKSLCVHVGGSMKRLLKPLAEAGVELVEGVCGPPQSDVPLPEARARAGSDLILWGGIPQDWLLEATPAEIFEDGVAEVIDHAMKDGKTILGVADRVPVAAHVDRLETLGELVRSRIID